MTDDDSLATLDLTSDPSPERPLGASRARVGTPQGSRSGTASADNLRLPRDADLIAQLRGDLVKARGDLVKAERRAQRAERALQKPKRTRAKEEAPDMAKRVKRHVMAWGLLVADGDPSDMKSLRDDLRKWGNDALCVAARGQHANGYSWTAIADAVGMTRQGARQQWGICNSTTKGPQS